MREPLKTHDLARIAGVDLEEIDRYCEAGLVDPDGDGLLDDLDVLRLRILLHYRSLGYSLEDLQKAIEAESPLILYSELLWAPQSEMVPAEEAAAELDLPPDAVQTLLRAVGLGPAIPRNEMHFLEAVKALVDSGTALKMVLDVGRVYGDTLRRLAQTEVRMIREFMTDQGKSSLLKDRQQSERLHQVQTLLVPILEPLLLTIHRRHLLRASVQEAVADLEALERGDDRETLQATIAFVDLASFTSLASVHGDETAADILDRFDELVRALLDEFNGNLVKQIGDEFMVAFPEPSNAVRFVVALDRAATHEKNFPALRTGVNSGPVLYRVGDYVGTTVNIASRITALAGPNEILLTEPVAHAAADIGVGVEWTGEQDVHGIEEPIPLWRVERVWAYDEPERDPVCGMAVDRDAVARLRHAGQTYAFCSAECLKRFLEDPDRYSVGVRSPNPLL